MAITLHESQGSQRLFTDKQGYYTKDDEIYALLDSVGRQDLIDHFRHTVRSREIALMHSELSEMLEAERRDRHLTPEDAHSLGRAYALLGTKEFHEYFADTAKGTLQEEIPDLLLRLCSFANLTHNSLEQLTLYKTAYNKSVENKDGKLF